MEEKGVGGHVLRRSGARALFDRLRHEGYDGALKRVQSMLGHSNSVISERYLSLGVERLQRNEMLAGKPMFPETRKPGTLSELKAV
jgi:integrase